MAEIFNLNLAKITQQVNLNLYPILNWFLDAWLSCNHIYDSAFQLQIVIILSMSGCGQKCTDLVIISWSSFSSLRALVL